MKRGNYPFATGNAVPEKVMAIVPDVVIAALAVRNAGTDTPTEVTVPVPGAEGVAHERVVPFDVST